MGTQQLAGDDAVHENGGLGIGGQLQLFGRAIETQVGEIKAEDLVRFVKALTREWLPFVEIVSHPDELGALSWKEKSHLLRHQQLLTASSTRQANRVLGIHHRPNGVN
jgi:hypothetical protein